MSLKIDYSKLDSGCAPLVEYFNLRGLSTFMLCQGYGTNSQSLFYISFSDAVTDDDILNFQKRHLDDRGCFCANGHFSKRCSYTRMRKVTLLSTIDGSTLSVQ